MILSIIIPVYNEESTIEKILDLIIKTKIPKNIYREIIIINDGSTDNTKSLILRKIKSVFKNYKNIRITLISKETNEGKGSAISIGLKKSSGDILLIQDADLEYLPSYYTAILSPIITNESNVVYGTRIRTMKLNIIGKNKTPFIFHYLMNRFLSYLTNVLYGSYLTDMETCYKVFTKSVYSQIQPLNSKGFEIEPEITAKILKKKINIVEVDIKTIPRGYKEGKKIQWYDALLAIYTLIKYKFK